MFPIRPDLSLERVTESASETEAEDQPFSGADPLSKERPEPPSQTMEGSPSLQGSIKEAETAGRHTEQEDDLASEAGGTLAGSRNASDEVDGSPSNGILEDGSGTAEDFKTGRSVESAVFAGSEGGESALGYASGQEDGPSSISDGGKELGGGSTDANQRLSERRITLAPAETERLTEEGNGHPAELFESKSALISASERERPEVGAPASEPSRADSATSDVSQEAVAGDATSKAYVSSPGSEATGTISASSEAPDDGSQAATCPSPVAGSPLQDVVEASVVGEAAAELTRVNDVSKNVTEAAEEDEATWDVWTDQDAQPLLVSGARVCVSLSLLFPLCLFPILSTLNSF